MDPVAALDTVANKCFDRLAAVQALASIGVENLALELGKMNLIPKNRSKANILPFTCAVLYLRLGRLSIVWLRVST